MSKVTVEFDTEVAKQVGDAYNIIVPWAQLHFPPKPPANSQEAEKPVNKDASEKKP